LDAILIESSGISEPIHVAETFFHARKLPSSRDFASLVKLDTMCTVIDCGAFMSTFKQKADSASDEANNERSINDLLLDQDKFADVILLNKTDLIKPPHTLDDIKAVIRDLNPFAVLRDCQRGDVPVECLVQTGLFSFKRAGKHADW
jgi:G3E family GTPase